MLVVWLGKSGYVGVLYQAAAKWKLYKNSSKIENLQRIFIFIMHHNNDSFFIIGVLVADESYLKAISLSVSQFIMPFSISLKATVSFLNVAFYTEI